MSKPSFREELATQMQECSQQTASVFRVLQGLPQILRNTSPKVMLLLGIPTFSDLVRWDYKVPEISVQKVKCSWTVLAQELPTGLSKAFKYFVRMFVLGAVSKWLQSIVASISSYMISFQVYSDKNSLILFLRD